ncbi:MAG: hypothetical protein QM790_21155 [Nibricoccus sp.]
MKILKHATFFSLLALAALAFSGCMMFRTTSHSDVDRVKVTFASERAGRLFYETLSRMPKNDRADSESHVILVVVNWEHKKVVGPNRAFNAAVERCDTDKDGIITDEEAQIFASSVKSNEKN